MGVMRFLVPRRDLMAPDAIERAYVAGLDEIPWQTRSHWSDGELAVERRRAIRGTFSFLVQSTATAS